MCELLNQAKATAENITDETIKNIVLEPIKLISQFLSDLDDPFVTFVQLQQQIVEIANAIKNSQNAIHAVTLADPDDNRSKRNANNVLTALLNQGIDLLGQSLANRSVKNQTLSSSSSSSSNTPIAMATGNQAGRDVNVTAIGQQHIHPPKPPTEEEIRKQLHLWQLPMLSQNFIGRTELLSALHGKITNSKRSVAITACHGLGGIGKTQLVLKYVDEHHQEYQNVFWFTAETEDQLLLNYRNLAEKLYLPIEGKSAQEVAGQVKHWLENHTDWLVVYDNVQDPQLLKSYQPNHGGRVIITSRRADWIGIPQLEVNVFSKKEAEDYIVKITGLALEQYQSDIDALAKQLGCLPLALAQACAYIAANKITLQEYLKLYEENRKEMLAEKVMPMDTSHEPVAVTWQITFKAIKEKCPAALPLLVSCAYLHADSIPEFLLKGIFNKQQAELANQFKPFIDALGCLQQYSMLKQSNENGEKKFSIHRLVQDVMFDSLSTKRKQKTLIEVFYVLNELFNSKPNEEKSEDYIRQFSLLPHLEKYLNLIEEFLEEVKTKISSDELEKEKLIKLIETDVLIELLILIATIKEDMGDAIKGKELLERVLPIIKKNYGAQNIKLAKILGNLANLYGDSGNEAKKIEFLKQAESIFEKLCGRNSKEIASVLVNLGDAYRVVGDAQTSKILLEEALLIFEKLIEPNHVMIGRTLLNLANAYYIIGDFHESKKLFENSLNIFKEKYGEDHPQFGLVLLNSGCVFGELGDANEKEKRVDTAFNIFKKLYGNKHLYTVAALSELGDVKRVLNKNTESISLLEQARSTLVEIYGDINHPLLGDILRKLGNAYGALKNVGKQKELLERALLIEEEYYKKDNPDVAQTLVSLSNAYGALGDAVKQKELLKRACQIFMAHPDAGPQHPHTQTAKQKLDVINRIVSNQIAQSSSSGSSTEMKDSDGLRMADKEKQLGIFTEKEEGKATSIFRL